MSEQKKPKKRPVNKATGKPLTEEEIIKRRRARKRREMKRKKQRQKAALLALLLFVIVIGAIFLLTRKPGSKFVEADETTLSLTSEGAIIFEEIIPAKEDMVEKDLEDFVKAEIAGYRTEEENAVLLEKVEVDEEKAYVRIRYKDVATYSKFTGYDAFLGTISEAQRKGYPFTSAFLRIEEKEQENADGKKGEVSTVIETAEATRDEVMSDSGAKIFVIQENVRVALPGGYTFVSAEGTKCEPGFVRISPIDDNPDSAPLTYIVLATEEVKENK